MRQREIPRTPETESTYLASFAVAICHIDIVQLEVVGLDAEGARLVVAQPVFLAELGCDVDLVLCIAAGVGRVAVDGELGTASADQHLLRVRSGLYEYALVCRRRGWQRVHSRLDGFETPVRAHFYAAIGGAGALDCQHSCGEHRSN